MIKKYLILLIMAMTLSLTSCINVKSDSIDLNSKIKVKLMTSEDVLEWAVTNENKPYARLWVIASDDYRKAATEAVAYIELAKAIKALTKQ